MTAPVPDPIQVELNKTILESYLPMQKYHEMLGTSLIEDLNVTEEKRFKEFLDESNSINVDFAFVEAARRSSAGVNNRVGNSADVAYDGYALNREILLMRQTKSECLFVAAIRCDEEKNYVEQLSFYRAGKAKV